MSVAVTDGSQDTRRSPVRRSLGGTIARARAQSLANRQCARRVRQEARDAVAVVLFSATASTALALAITLVVTLVG